MNHLRNAPSEQMAPPRWIETVELHHDQVPAAEIPDREASTMTVKIQPEVPGVMTVAEGDLGQDREINKIGRGSAADREIIHIETETGTVTVTEVGEIG